MELEVQQEFDLCTALYNEAQFAHTSLLELSRPEQREMHETWFQEYQMNLQGFMEEVDFWLSIVDNGGHVSDVPPEDCESQIKKRAAEKK